MRARFPQFDFSNLRAHWAPNVEFAQRANAASLILPISSLSSEGDDTGKKKIDPAKAGLHRDLDIFIKQEMQRWRQHMAFNRRMHDLGYELLKPIEAEFEGKRRPDPTLRA
ncbi:metal-dependent hydrolase [Novosphingobium sp. CCH12-A3]|uniref:metal-dependent hydrolase n=1 Tax=Novosphingobium sp. CCH12-A3 TaxID=1768752 RepID=UPI000780BF91|nr:metal-dependent hydrolase [Novosphingobium sp. CCH12-A3]